MKKLALLLLITITVNNILAQSFNGKHKVEAGLTGSPTIYTSEAVYGGLSFYHATGKVFFKSATLADPQGNTFKAIKPESNPILEITYQLPSTLAPEHIGTTPKKYMVKSSILFGGKTKTAELPLMLSKNERGEIQYVLTYTDKLANLVANTDKKNNTSAYFNFSGILTAIKN